MIAQIRYAREGREYAALTTNPDALRRILQESGFEILSAGNNTASEQLGN
jgi:hypothetical protein